MLGAGGLGPLDGVLEGALGVGGREGLRIVEIAHAAVELDRAAATGVALREALRQVEAIRAAALHIDRDGDEEE
jgi:hypothetical protein